MKLPNRRQKILSLAMRHDVLYSPRTFFTLQRNMFIANNEVVSATHLQLGITPLMNRVIASDELVLCFGRAVLALKDSGVGKEGQPRGVRRNMKGGFQN